MSTIFLLIFLFHFLQGEGELSPVGVLYALRYLAAFTTATRVAALDPTAAAAASTASPGNKSSAAGGGSKVGLLQLSRREGILNVVSSILFPAVSDDNTIIDFCRCDTYSWCLSWIKTSITPSSVFHCC